MRKIFLSLFLFLFLQSSFGQKNPAFDFNKLYSYVLQGDVSRVISVLDTLQENDLNSQQKLIKEKFYHRFKYQDEVTNYNTDDPILQDILKIYQDYWKKVLLDKENVGEPEERLKKRILTFLKNNNYPFQNSYVKDTLTEKEIENNFNQHLKNFLSEHNYFSATGQTAGIYDLFIWSTEVPVEYHVDLPETEITTTIIFMEDVVTMGWEEYASFGKVYPGGWATKEVLYAVGKAYDTETENFRVSYLKHESQHFADYKTFPNLSGADLEYRAKLVELIYAEETFDNLISSFIKNASSEGRNPHAFGGYAVIRDLSRVLFRKDFVSDIRSWKKISTDRTKKESENLLKEHTKELKEAGANTVIEFIK